MLYCFSLWLTRSCMLQCKVFICKFFTIYRFSTSSILFCKISSLMISKKKHTHIYMDTHIFTNKEISIMRNTNPRKKKESIPILPDTWILESLYERNYPWNEVVFLIYVLYLFLLYISNENCWMFWERCQHIIEFQFFLLVNHQWIYRRIQQDSNYRSCFIVVTCVYICFL